MLCSRCQLQHYCCKKCQKRHWKQHRSVCLQSNAEPEVTARLMNGEGKTFRLDSTSPVSLLYSLVETWVIDIPITLQADTGIVLFKDADVLKKDMTLADYDLPNGDADVSVVVQEKEPPGLQDSSSEDGETGEAAAAAASSASETESSSAEFDDDDFVALMMAIRFGPSTIRRLCKPTKKKPRRRQW